MQLQIARRRITVVSRWSWVASGGAVLLGNVTADADCQTLYNGGLKVVIGCEWWRRVIGECNCRFLDAL